MHLPSLDLSRAIPLFPLPNCVLFPGAVQPLHIFEPRYREMMEATLEEQRAIAMALLRPGWEKSYYGSPAVYPVTCVGRVVAHERVEDGKYNLLLLGAVRARIVTEQRRGMHRVAMLEEMPDLPVAAEGEARAGAQRALLKELFARTAIGTLTIAPTLLSLFEDDLPHGRLVDALAFGLVQEVGAKQMQLEETDPLKRGEMLLREMAELAGKLGGAVPAVGGGCGWPPAASNN